MLGYSMATTHARTTMKYGLLVCLLLIPGVTMAQSRLIRGTVRTEADGTVIPGSTVALKGKSAGTANAAGSFTLTAPNRSVTLIVRAPGYHTKAYTLSRTVDTVTIRLSDDSRMLPEVVVMGYGTVPRRDIITVDFSASVPLWRPLPYVDRFLPPKPGTETGQKTPALRH